MKKEQKNQISKVQNFFKEEISKHVTQVPVFVVMYDMSTKKLALLFRPETKESQEFFENLIDNSILLIEDLKSVTGDNIVNASIDSTYTTRLNIEPLDN